MNAQIILHVDCFDDLFVMVREGGRRLAIELFDGVELFKSMAFTWDIDLQRVVAVEKKLAHN